MPSPPPAPTDVLPLIPHGLSWGGASVGRVVLYDPAGRQLADVIVPEPPTVVGPPAVKDWAATACGEQILATLAEYGRPATARQLAKLSGYANGGSFREKLLGLLGQGRVLRDCDGFYSLPEPNSG